MRGKPTGRNSGNGKPPKPMDSGTGGTTSPTGKYALVIRIANYCGSSYDLQYCDDDARERANYLSGKGYTVHTLIDIQATAANIDSELNWLNSMENAGDTVVFIYSGHGIYGGGSSNILSYELAYVSDSYMANKFATFSSTTSTKMFFEFDACQIGGMKAVGATGRFVAMASNTKTYSYDGTSSMANGVFTYYYLYALQNLGYTSVEDAYAYAKQKSESSYPMTCTYYDGYSGNFQF
ncbi:MAG: caspase family protein [Thermoplasmata archaeon]